MYYLYNLFHQKYCNWICTVLAVHEHHDQEWMQVLQRMIYMFAYTTQRHGFMRVHSETDGQKFLPAVAHSTVLTADMWQQHKKYCAPLKNESQIICY